MDTKTAIEVTRLSTRQGDSFGLKDISFKIGKGELVIITGHNGCGKVSLNLK
jgi:ABC-type transport system involved in cytochrome c biogenesis ATPase subunit